MIDVIIVNYNSFELIYKQLLAFQKYSLENISSVIVVDNSSDTAAFSEVLDDFHFLTYLPAPSNLGFARAVNFAYKHSTADYILILNPDIMLPSRDIFSQLLRTFMIIQMQRYLTTNS